MSSLKYPHLKEATPVTPVQPEAQAMMWDGSQEMDAKIEQFLRPPGALARTMAVSYEDRRPHKLSIRWQLPEEQRGCGHPERRIEMEVGEVAVKHRGLDPEIEIISQEELRERFELSEEKVCEQLTLGDVRLNQKSMNATRRALNELVEHVVRKWLSESDDSVRRRHR